MTPFKFISLLKKKADMSREDFIAYYETHHVPLILELFPTIETYIRNFRSEDEDAWVYPEAPPFEYDCITELIFADEAGYQAMVERAADPEILQRIAEDEIHFLDSSQTRMFRVDCYATRNEQAK